MLSKSFIVSVVVVIVAVGSGWIIGNNGAEAGLTMLGVLVAVPIMALVLVKPHVGVFLTMFVLPFDRFYSNLSFGASFLSLLGFFTLASYLIQTRFVVKSRLGVTPVYIFAFGFIIWLFIANPSAALGSRNWMFTYIQLIVLMWLAAEVMTPKRQSQFMLLYALIIIAPAIASFSQGRLDSTIFTTERAEGFVANANEFAMYLLVGIPFALRILVSPQTKFIVRFALLFALTAAIMGVVFSVSRTGSIALAATLILGVILYPKLSIGGTPKERTRNTSNLLIVVVVLVLIGSRLIPQQYWSIMQEAQRQIEAGTEADRGTFVERLDLWETAVQDWQKSPIIGIGAGNFAEAHESVVHNMYLTILTEQGVVGLVLFVAWLGTATVNLIRVAYFSPNKKSSSLAAAWLMVMVGMLIVGITNSFHYYKIQWFAAGISLTYFLPKVEFRRGRIAELTEQPVGTTATLGEPAGQTS